jgi:uncharacterized protein
MQVFAIPIGDDYIVYRPLLQLAFVGNKAMADLARGLANGPLPATDGPSAGLGFLRDIGFLEPDPPPPAPPAPSPPTSVTLLTTNRCTLRCTYCYADAGVGPAREMPIELAKPAIDTAVENALALGRESFDLTFHGGGEPTLAWDLIREATEHARSKPLPCHVSMVSNGVWSAEHRRWILDNLDSISLSVDGTPDTQDRQRPLVSGRGSFDLVMQTIREMDERGFPYGIRMTATAPWGEQLAEDVRFICEQTQCRSIQVEPAFNTERGVPRPPTEEEAGAFVEGFMAAYETATMAGRILYYSGSRPWLVTSMFCTAPFSSLTVSDTGALVSCYEVTDRRHPLADASRFGTVANGLITVDEVVRGNLLGRLEERRDHCQGCFNYWNCAGDCYSRVMTTDPNSHLEYGTRCEVNRTITAEMLLWYIASGDGVWRGPAATPLTAPQMELVS